LKDKEGDAADESAGHVAEQFAACHVRWFLSRHGLGVELFVGRVDTLADAVVDPCLDSLGTLTRKVRAALLNVANVVPLGGAVELLAFHAAVRRVLHEPQVSDAGTTKRLRSICVGTLQNDPKVM